MHGALPSLIAFAAEFDVVMSLGRAFLGTLVAVALAVIAYAGAEHLGKRASIQSTGQRLLGDVFVSDQVTLHEVERLPDRGYKSLIDLRPDGEAADQPGSAEVAKVAAAKGLQFAYVPTPHGDIPDAVVSEFARALAGAPKPVMLYCRSGKRASRVWALAEASRAGGATEAEISAAVSAVGQSVDDLKDRIAVLIAARSPVASP